MLLRASVIIPTYRDWEKVAACLRALAVQDLDPADFEVIIANNNPENEIPDTLPLARNTRVIWVETPGSYAARNAALRIACGQYVFFTDADCIPVPSWLSRGLYLFETREKCKRIAGGIIVRPSSGKWNGWSVFDRTFRLRQEQYVQRGAAVTANLAVERSLFAELGPFNEAIFSGQDMEWNRRASAARVPLIFDEAMSVAHPARDTFQECASKMRRIAGARFTAKSGRPISQRSPRLKYLFPSFKDFVEIWSCSSNAPAGARLSAMLCHYAMGWVYNAEIIRLGFLGGKPSRK